MFKDLEIKLPKKYTAIVAGGIITILFLAVIYISLAQVSIVSVRPINFQILANNLLEVYWFPIIILIIALLTTLIEAISLARRD